MAVEVNYTYPNYHCPPGLELLTTLQELVLKPNSEKFDYVIKLNEEGEKIYFVTLDKDDCLECFCGRSLNFSVRIQDGGGQEVIHINSEDKQADVQAPPKTFIGRIEKEHGSFKSHHFQIYNSSGQTILYIKKLSGVSSGSAEARRRNRNKTAEFQVLSNNLINELGRIHRERKGMFLPTYHYKLMFCPNMDVGTKVILIGAAIYIDRLYFQ